MAENEQLNAFLAEAAEAPEPAPSQALEAPPAPPKPTPDTSKPDTKPPEDDDDHPPQPLEGEQVVGFRAYENERRRRQDWKEKAARLEGELAAYKAQQEQARQPQPEQPQRFAFQPVDPTQDPQGFVSQVQQWMINERLNNSEANLREKLGDDRVAEYVAEFKQHAQADPSLFPKLYSQPNPYGWMAKEIDRLRLLRDVGDDPGAYRAKIEAEARAKWEAEAATRVQAPPPSPATGLQPSLATARSVAGRSAPAWTGEPSDEDVLAPIQNRKRTNGTGRPVRF